MLTIGAAGAAQIAYTWSFADGSTCGHEHPTTRQAADCREVTECITHSTMARTLAAFRWAGGAR